ncbi:hypothetical protein [Endozoicomonas sp. ISHI1]|uniref:hypothetical protein n=1 Tax=Endozoicomonas sp. ISHI1 TaxID=2825882 RepID=UPI0021496B18|nr:hypothetical protein [Endozoicomonas sp. ISHI1]
MLLLLSVACQAGALTRSFIVGPGQDAVFPNQSFSIKRGRHTLSQSPSVTADKNGCVRLDLSSDSKRHKPVIYGIRTITIESISRQPLYATHLWMDHEMILTTKNAHLGAKPDSWLPFEVVITVSWLLKSYWNPDSVLFKPIEQQKAISLLKGEYAFATSIMTYGSGDNPSQYSPLELPSQQVLAATSHPKGSLAHLLYSEYGGGNRDPHQYLHSLGLNCFVHPCYGVCQFRLSGSLKSSYPDTTNEHGFSCINYFDPANATQSTSTGLICTSASDRAPNDNVQIPADLSVTADDQIIIDGLLSLAGHSFPEGNGISITLTHSTRPMRNSALNCLPSEGATHCQKALSNDKKKYDTKHEVCVVTVIGKDGRQRPCGKVFKGASYLSSHKRRNHTGQKTCDVTVFEEAGQRRPCGKVFGNANALSDHKSRAHGRQKICGVTVVGENGQPRQCGRVCKNIYALSNHKRREHTGQKTCDVTVVGVDGQLQPCGLVCKNAKSLADHKRRHRKRKTVGANQYDVPKP